MQTATAVAWRRTPVIALGIGGAAIIAAVGLAFSRPDIVAIGLPLALAAAWALLRRPSPGEARIALRAHAAGSVDRPEVQTAADVVLAADAVQIAVDQDGRRTGLVDVRPGTACLTARGVLQHSGPSEPLAVTLRGRVSTARGSPISSLGRRSPGTRRRARCGSAASRWRRGSPDSTGRIRVPARGRVATSGISSPSSPETSSVGRLARDRPRRTSTRRSPGAQDDALSDSSVVLAIDTAEDLGAAVAAWGAATPIAPE